MEGTIDVDYLVVGAGAAGMAFTDSLLSGCDATVAIADRRDRAGGHWLDSYPFVRLHQPASYYGVSSEELSSGVIDTTGYNAGFHNLASGPEVVAYYDRVLHHRFVPSGRVRFLPLTDVDAEGGVTSLVSGEPVAVSAGRIVDARYSQMQVPSTHTPSFDVAQGAACVPVNDLPRRATDFTDFVVVGAGKTGMDACCWLLAHGVAPGRIRWVVPRDSWILDRANVQPDPEHALQVCTSLGNQAEAAATATSVDDLFERLEAAEELRRIDPAVTPRAYHCAILSDLELDALRTIEGVVRMGHVRTIGVDTIELADGSVPTTTDTLHVDCSAHGIPKRPTVPIFGDDRITIQFVRTCQPAFSAGLLGHAEATLTATTAEKNALFTPILPPDEPLDWLRMFVLQTRNRGAWNGVPELEHWLSESRLDPFQNLVQAAGADPLAAEQLGRYLLNAEAAMENLERLLAEAERSSPA